MIWNNKGKELVSLRVGNHQISTYYHIIQGTAKIIWQAIRSCFGSGMWVNKKSWINSEPWKTNHS